MKLIALLLIMLPGQALAFGRGRVAADPVTSSTILDGDATGLVEGCGQQPSPLGVFCRQQEGDAADKSLWFIGPPAKCERDACVYVKVWNNQGRLVWGDSIPKGQTRVKAPWKTLLERDSFAVGDRGFWTFNHTVFWKDEAGREQESTSQGDIILRVFKKGYVPLHSVPADPNFVWEWSEGTDIFKMTAGLRAFVGKL